MTAYVDFVPEETFVRDETRLRPDAVIRLPGDRYIVVDAKTSMAAYLDAVECVDDGEREAHLVRHAQQIRQHMKLLSAKAYWDGLTVTPDFVAMFVAGDNFFGHRYGAGCPPVRRCDCNARPDRNTDDLDRSRESGRIRLAAGETRGQRALCRRAGEGPLQTPPDHGCASHSGRVEHRSDRKEL